MHIRQKRLQKTITRVLFVVFVLFSTLEVVHVRRGLAQGGNESTTVYTPGSERIFIASIFWNNEAILRSTLSAALLQLVKHLGPDNVFISIHESGSWDDTKGALRDLDESLEQIGVKRKISTSNTTHLDEISKEPQDEGWVVTPQGQKELRRIPYLAKQRNIGLESLVELAERGIHFDRVLFINDVVFSTEDVLRLLGTNGGSYAAACSMDFKDPPSFYDTFALRDSHGDGHLMTTWPYFRSRTSREAMLRNEPVPVSSCWNGVGK